jgi:predicted nucleic acid-binding protein
VTFVCDTSALVHATTEEDEAARAVRARLLAEEAHAPHLLDAELGNVLRRRLARGQVTLEHAEAVLAQAPLLVDHRHEHTGALARAAWALRDRVTFYDALYVALAAALDVPLVTADARLAGAGGLPCMVELVG